MTYKVQSITKKVTSVGEVADLELEGVEGVVSMWPTHPHYKIAQVGYTVDGDIVEKGKYKTIYPVKAPTSSFKGGGVPKGIQGAMERKESSISQFQDNKEHSIMVASTASQATQILTALLTKQVPVKEDSFTIQSWKDQWVEIRHWLVKNWSNTEQRKIGDVDYPRNDFPEGTPF